MARKHPLGGLENQSPEEMQGKREAVYEEKIVAHLLGRYHLTKHKWDLINAQNEASGQRRLTLYQFHVMFPEFPIYLAAAKIPYLVKNCEVDKLFNKFGDRSIVQRYDTIFESVPPAFKSYPYGLVFHWPYISKGLILHDATASQEERGVRMFYRGKGSRVLCLEPFDQFLASDLTNDWSPAEE